MIEFLRTNVLKYFPGKLLGTVLAMLVFLLGAVAQNGDRAVSGAVEDSQGEPLVGVTVVVSNSTTGTVTDAEGKYSLNITSDASSLTFSYLGFEPQIVDIGSRSIIDVTLLEDIESLDEVVVVGYGTQLKQDLSGSIVNVKSDELTEYPSVSAVQALQGRAAGVSITSANGEPGGDYVVRIRGSASINASSNPLFVVDGIVGGVLPPPEDIASIDVLKDASASAIYGSRAANGVVIITSKSGSSGKMKVNFNSSYSVQNELDRLDVLEARDFAEYVNEARGTDFYPDVNNLEANTDWQDLIYRQGHIANNQLSISGGNDDVRYYVSGVLYDQDGVIETSGFKRYSINTKVDFNLRDNIKLSLGNLLRESEQDGVLSQLGSAALSPGVTTSAYRFEPTQGVLDDEGNYTLSEVGIAAFDNPRGVLDGRSINNNVSSRQTNLSGSWEIIEGLTWNSSLALSQSELTNRRYDNTNSNTGIANNGLASLSSATEKNIITEHYASYQAPLGESNSLLLTSGYSYQKQEDEFFSAGAAGFLSDDISYWNLGAGSFNSTPSSGTTKKELVSYFGRLNYSFMDRYYLVVSGRYDGASQFSDDNKYSFFPSVAGSWNLSNESFFPSSSIFSTVKIRGSWGKTGNQAIGPYESFASVTSVFFASNGNAQNAITPQSIANKDLTWETTTQTDFGIDLELFSGRLSLVADYYVKSTTDLIFELPLPQFTGYSSQLANIGEVENKGYELAISSINVDSDLRWTTTLNLSMNENKIVSLPNGDSIIVAGAPTNIINGPLNTSILVEGQPVGSFFGWIYDGVYGAGDTFLSGDGFEEIEGGERFVDLDNSGDLGVEDRSIIGDPNPDLVWGLNNQFRYKNFDMSIFFQGVIGGDVLNLTKMELDVFNGIANATTDALNRYSSTNTNTDIPIANQDRIARTSTRFIEDGSYTRLKNLVIGYTFPRSVLGNTGIVNLRVYASGQNLLTFTDYSGVDPEVAYGRFGSAGSNLNRGLDYGSYPNAKSFTFGINLGF